MGTRRRFVLGTLGVAGALVVGWGVMPPRQRLLGSTSLPVTPGQVAFNGFVKVDSDNRITVIVPKSEMGQGVLTSIAMLLADEMDADWSQLSVEHGPIDAIYNNQATLVDGLPFRPDDEGTLKRVAGWLTAKTMREVGTMMTGGSSTVKDLWLPAREAGASARAMLLGAAADVWKLPAAECRTERGRVLHASGKSASFGELAAAASTRRVPMSPPLKDVAAFKLIGKPMNRIEGTSKVNGSAVFGIDVVQPAMLIASVQMCPTLGGRVASHDATAALAMPGVKKVVVFEGQAGGTGGVAAIAQTHWQAMQAAKAVVVTWDHGAAADFNSADLMRRMTTMLDTEQGHAYWAHGDAAQAMKGAVKTLKADYQAPFLAHTTMEPMNCTVLFEPGPVGGKNAEGKVSRATVWVPTQVPGFARLVAARALDIPTDAIDVQVQLLGGGFGRRLEVDFVAQAAQIARAMPGVPVQTFWSREEDTRHDFYRPAAVARFEAGLDAQGRVVAWQAVSLGPSVVHQVLKRLFGVPGAGPDKTTSEGVFDQPYEFAAARVGHKVVDVPVPVGFWRSVGHSHHAFFKECFIDELATAAGQDPLAFRLSLLKQHPRHARVLQRAADLAGWGKPTVVVPTPAVEALATEAAPPSTGSEAKRARGIALHASFGSIVAQVAEVSIDASTNKIRVHRVVCVVDCGMPVNPNHIRQQMEGGIVFGLSAALYGDLSITKGQVMQSNFHDTPALRIDECPDIQVDIIPSGGHPDGVGEPGVPPVAPAVANALFVLTGQRLRVLPLKLG